jgi:hypothetical protein
MWSARYSPTLFPLLFEMCPPAYAGGSDRSLTVGPGPRTDGCALNAVNQRVARECEGVTKPRDGQALAADGQALRADGQASAADGQALRTDGRASRTNGRALPRDGQALPRDGRALASDRQASAADGQALAADRRALRADDQAWPADSGALTRAVEHQAETIKQAAPAVKHWRVVVPGVFNPTSQSKHRWGASQRAAWLITSSQTHNCTKEN